VKSARWRGEETTPETVRLPGARQIARLRRRVRRHRRASTETVHLISSRPLSELAAPSLAALKRAYWKIESTLHCQLDEVLEEDRSRVRTPRAAHVLGLFRRLSISFAIPWLAERQKTLRRASTRDFHDHLRADHARRAHPLVTAAAPAAWLP
jgi:hypothetical protein